MMKVYSSIVNKNFLLTSAILRRRVDALRAGEQVHDRRGLLAGRGRHHRHMHLLLPRHMGVPVHQVHEVSLQSHPLTEI